MRTTAAIVGMVAIFAMPWARAKDRDVCNMRADIVNGVASQRDKGLSKSGVKKAMAKAMPQFPSWLIDFIWDHPELSAKQIAAKDFEICLKTP